MLDRKAIARALFFGLDAIPKTGVPGRMTSFGSDSMCHLTTSTNDCVMGAALYGSGRVVAMAHNGYMMDVMKPERSRDLNVNLKNAILWSSRKQQEKLLCMSNEDLLGLGGSSPGGFPFSGCENLPIAVAALGMSLDKLKSIVEGVTSSEGQIIAVASEGQSTLENVKKIISAAPDVILWTNSNTHTEITGSKDEMDERAETLLQYTAQGGGLIVAVCPWGWDQSANVLPTQCVFNHFLHETGLTFLDGYAGGADNNGFPVAYAEDKIDKGGSFQEEMEKMLDKVESRVEDLRFDELQTAIRQLDDVPVQFFKKPRKTRAIPQRKDFNNENLITRVDILANTYGRSALSFPIKAKDSLTFPKNAAYLYMSYVKKTGKTIHSSDCPIAYPLETIVPGSLKLTAPGAKNRDGFLFTPNRYLKRLQTVGLYLAPGQEVIASISDQALQSYKDLRIKIQVGIHSDELPTIPDENFELKRHPKIVTEREWKPRKMGKADYQPFATESGPAETSTVSIASPYGGLLYLELVSGVDQVEVETPLTFNFIGGHLAPYMNLQRTLNEFVHNKFTDSYPYEKSFDEILREYSNVPFGEIEGRFVIMTVPTETLQSALEKGVDFRRVAELYDDILKHELALSGQVLDFKERIVMDVQISAGWLHSGYPVMGHLALFEPSERGIPNLLDVDTMLEQANWGIYHELGHNRQKSVWTFEGCGEVTVNIFSLYCTHMINKDTPYKSRYYIDSCRDKAIQYLKPNSSMTFANHWQKDPNVGLPIYVMLIEELGWKVIADVFRKYENEKIQANSEQEKITQWVNQTSLVSGIDLRDFYSQWKWPFDNSKLEHLRQYPPWNKDAYQLAQRN